jgi:hypothetical protein
VRNEWTHADLTASATQLFAIGGSRSKESNPTTDDETVTSGTQKHFVRVMWSFRIPRPKEDARSRMGQFFHHSPKRLLPANSENTQRLGRRSDAPMPRAGIAFPDIRGQFNSCENYTILSVSCGGMSHPYRKRSESGHVCGRARVVSGRMLSCEGLCSC